MPQARPNEIFEGVTQATTLSRLQTYRNSCDQNTGLLTVHHKGNTKKNEYPKVA